MSNEAWMVLGLMSGIRGVMIIRGYIALAHILYSIVKLAYSTAMCFKTGSPSMEKHKAHIWFILNIEKWACHLYNSQCGRLKTEPDYTNITNKEVVQLLYKETFESAIDGLQPIPGYSKVKSAAAMLVVRTKEANEKRATKK